MKLRWRDLAWFIVLLGVVGLVSRQQSSGSQPLDGQSYRGSMSDRETMTLDLENGKFKQIVSSCYSSVEDSGVYRLAGTRLVLYGSLGPDQQYKLWKSAGRTHLDSMGSGFHCSLKLVADPGGGPFPPRWSGGPLRVNGLYPGMSKSAFGPDLQLFKTAGDFALYSTAQRDLAALVKDGRVVTVGGPRLMEADGSVLLESREQVDWIEKCLGQKHRTTEGLEVFPCGLALGTQGHFYGSYFLGEASGIEILQLAMIVGEANH